MRSLIDFFNHGILPFVGRTGETERILSFWKGTTEAPGLRAALIVGEAGVGKSRLVEETMPRIVQDGGVVVHAKLYPGAATSMAPLIARALWQSAGARQLLKKEPEQGTDGVITALRRLARLRPTLLVLEDIHLLAGESLAEFSALLDGLADETLSILCLARPVELGARGILERYLVEEIDLAGLDREELTALWQRMLDTAPDPAIVEVLVNITSGNPLALRSALRGALKSGALVRGSNDGPWRVVMNADTFGETLGRHVGLLSEGMAAHLNPVEREAAQQLACLGEVFCRETASAMIDDAARMISILTFKGILSPSVMPSPPISGAPCAQQLVFTHSLLHRYLVEQAKVEVDRLLLVVASGLPLNSVVPFQILADAGNGVKAPVAEVRRAIERTIDVAEMLDSTTDWEIGINVLETAWALFEPYAERWSEEERRTLRIKLLRGWLLLHRRRNHTDEYGEKIDQLLDLTAGPLPEELREYRISALRYRFHRLRRVDPETCLDIVREVDELVEHLPRLRNSRCYIMFIQSMALTSGLRSDRQIKPLAEERFDELMAREDLPEEMRRFALNQVGPHLISAFNNEEELRGRMQLLAELEASPNSNTVMLRAHKIALLQGLGYMDEALATSDDVVPQLRERGLIRHVYQCLLIRLYALGCLGLEIAEMERQLERVVTEGPEEMRGWLRERAGVHFCRVGILRGEMEWARKMIGTRLADEEKLSQEDRIMLASAEGTIPATLRAIDDGEGLEPIFGTLAPPILEGRVDDAGALVERLRQIVREPILTRSTLMEVTGILTLIGAVDADMKGLGLVEQLRADLHDCVVRMLEWCDVRRLPVLMGPILTRFGAYLPAKELATWKSRGQALAAERTAEQTEAGSDVRLSVSMLGTIEVCEPGGEPHRVRGARLRLLLGLMVADGMLDKPLSYREFCRLAASGEEDPERARKVMNMAVLRLRELIGTDAVLTDRETPRLNLDRMRVDLLEAHHALREAEEAVREGSLMRSLPMLLQALEIARGEIPFPTLFDDFFEAAREDFEFALRSTIIAVARGLLREGDPGSAESALRRGFEAMPEDEEISELLRETLVTLGKRIEAERVRMRAADALAE